MGKYNPYMNQGAYAQSVPSEFYRLDSVVPRTLKDKEELGTLFDRFGIIPAYGSDDNTSHSFLYLLNELAKLSPSFNSAIGSLSSFAFGLEFDMAARSYPGLITPQEEMDIPYAAKLEYASVLDGYGIPLSSLLNVSRILFRHLWENGNAYLQVTRVRVGDSMRYRLDVLHYTQCAYMNSYDPGLEFIIHTHIWDDQFMNKYPPTIAPVTYPDDEELKWVDYADGSSVAIIHFRNQEGIDESEYYGRSKLLSCLDWMATDIFTGVVTGKVSATEIVSKKILAFEEPNPDLLREEVGDVDEFTARLNAIRTVATNVGGRGEVKSIAGIEYPYGTKPPQAITLEVNRDYLYNRFAIDYASSFIYATLDWVPELSGLRQARTGLGSNLMRDLLVVKQTSVIKPIQKRFSGWMNNLAEFVLTDAGYTGDLLGLEYQDTISDLVEALGGGNDIASGNPLEDEGLTTIEE